RVFTLEQQAMPKVNLAFELGSQSALGGSVHVSTASNSRGLRRSGRHADRFQRGRIQKRDQVIEPVVEVCESHNRAPIPESLFDANVEGLASRSEEHTSELQSHLNLVC